MGGNPFGLILSIGSVRIVVSFTCCDLRRAFLLSYAFCCESTCMGALTELEIA